MTESVIAVSSGEAGPSWPRAESTPSGVGTPVTMPADEAPPPAIAKQSTTTESDIVVSSGEAGLSWPRAKSTPSAVDATVTKAAGEAREVQRHIRIRARIRRVFC